MHDYHAAEALVEQLSLHDEFEAISCDTGTKGVQEAKTGNILWRYRKPRTQGSAVAMVASRVFTETGRIL